MSLSKQNNQGCLEPAGDLPAFEDVLQDILDHDAMQRVLNNDNSFSEDSECCADSSKEMDDEITQFDKARAHQAQQERMLGEPDWYELDEDDKLHIRSCYLAFYANLDNDISD